MAPVHRAAARLLCVSPEGRVLLTEWHDPARPDDWHWIPPGGAVEPGETAAEAAVRETREETGIVVDVASVSLPVHTGEEPFSWDGRDYVSHETYVAVDLDEDVEVSFEGLLGPEVGHCRAAAWWTPDALDEAGTAASSGLTTAMRAAVAVLGRQA